MMIPKYEVSGRNVLKDGHTMFVDDVVKDIQALQRKVADSAPHFSDRLEPLVRCENCDGYGVISFNPNLNPNSFPCTATAKCTRCEGTGIEDTANDLRDLRGKGEKR